MRTGVFTDDAVLAEMEGRVATVRGRAAPGTAALPYRQVGAGAETMISNPLMVAFEQGRPSLRRYLLARGCGDETDDLLQEIWLKAAGGATGHVADPLPYLYRMAHNLLLDRVRERRRRADREQTFHDCHRGVSRPDEPSLAERGLLAREQLKMIERTLAALGPRTDMIFRRHRLEKVPQQQLAQELGVTLSAVEKQLQRAYRAIAAGQRCYMEGRYTEGQDRERGDDR